MDDVIENLAGIPVKRVQNGKRISFYQNHEMIPES
jgi:hypothetical protein